jgi:formate hydrogenlyase subunit 6/NADH:ubiquinone oxidoreductase subunit I
MSGGFFPLRPPGAGGEKGFLRRCVRCGQCAHICPWQCIRMEGGFGERHNTPVIRPREIPCRLCMKCPPLCPSGALDNSVRSMERAGMGRARILKNRCYNFTSDTMCWTCHDHCPLRGTAMVLENGIAPAVTEDCVGCGVCEYVCPIRAILTIPAEALRHAF